MHSRRRYNASTQAAISIFKKSMLKFFIILPGAHRLLTDVRAVNKIHLKKRKLK